MDYRVIEIKKNNEHLLNRLLHIAKGKESLIKHAGVKKEPDPVKSLNFYSKKKEAQRIDRDN